MILSYSCFLTIYFSVIFYILSRQVLKISWGECVSTVNTVFFLPKFGLDLLEGLGMWYFAKR